MCVFSSSSRFRPLDQSLLVVPTLRSEFVDLQELVIMFHLLRLCVLPCCATSIGQLLYFDCLCCQRYGRTSIVSYLINDLCLPALRLDFLVGNLLGGLV